MPVRNEARHIGATLRTLLTQDYPADRFEVIVVDGQSTDATVAITRGLQDEFPNLRLLYNPKRLSSAARNLGVLHGRGDCVVIVDGHCEIRGRRYLADCASAFISSKAECLGRPQPLDVTGATPFQRAVAEARRSWLGHNPGSHIYSSRAGYVAPHSVAVAYRREVFERVGLFDERFDACEDVDFNHRVAAAGFTCWFEPAIRAYYVPRATPRALLYQTSRYGTGRMRLARKHPETLGPAGVAPSLFIVWLAALAVASPFSAWAIVALAGSLAAYLATATAVAVGIARRTRDWVAAAWVVPVIGCIHVGFGWGMLREALWGERGA
jgi:succinoglycan biosynthesis protein ExoA